MITRILVDKPDNVMKELEDLSRTLKAERLSTSTELLKIPREKTPTETIASAHVELLQVSIGPRQVKILYSYFMAIWSIFKTIGPRCCGKLDALLPEAESQNYWPEEPWTT